jgi:glycosyltransferase involved in cell wall biosynthesis
VSFEILQNDVKKMNKPLLSVIMPVYNERETLTEILAQVRAVDLEKEIVVVDDGSTDGTRDILREEEKRGDLKVFYHQANKGKGAAVRTALEHACGDFIVIQDADLEYDPQDYHKLLKPILEGQAEVVYGSRFMEFTDTMFFLQALGNRIVTLVTNVLYGTALSDMETCYKAFRTEVIKSIPLRSRRFELEPEITAKLLKRGYRIHEVPISYQGREYQQGKKLTWRDGITALWTLIKYRFVD